MSITSVFFIFFTNLSPGFRMVHTYGFLRVDVYVFRCQRENTNMVKNKQSGGRLIFTCKPTKGESQTASSKDQTLLDELGDGVTPAAPPEPQTTCQSQQGFPDRVYLLASVIFQNNHLEKPASQRLVNYSPDRGLPLPKVKYEEMQRAAYELAFNTLKCKYLSAFIYSYWLLISVALIFHHVKSTCTVHVNTLLKLIGKYHIYH